MNLFGDGCERTVRTTGRATYVAPLMCIGMTSKLWAWVGFREEWQRGGESAHPRKFSFQHVGVAVYFGRRHAARKVQMFRAEWSGAALSDESMAEATRGVGDPHWHFDGMESLFRLDAEVREGALRVQRFGKETDDARHFGPREVTSNEFDALISRRRVSRVHFPSAAAWWRSKPHDTHAHAPSSAKEIEVWVDKTVSYLVEELARLEGRW